eukprot:scaffold279043_cov37-Tisochrysis_lutea.AAC.1
MADGILVCRASRIVRKHSVEGTEDERLGFLSPQAWSVHALEQCLLGCGAEGHPATRLVALLLEAEHRRHFTGPSDVSLACRMRLERPCSWARVAPVHRWPVNRLSARRAPAGARRIPGHIGLHRGHSDERESIIRRLMDSIDDCSAPAKG